MRQKIHHGFLYWLLSAVLFWWATMLSCTGGGKTSNTPPTQTSVSGIQFSPSTVTGGQSSTGTVTLSQTAPSGGSVVTLSCNNAAVQVPGSVTVAAGSISATFIATTSTVSSAVVATVTAMMSGAAQANLAVVGAQFVVGGLTQSTNFPMVNANRTTFAGGQEGALTAWYQGLTSFAFSTYVGGNGSDDQVRAMALDAQGNIYIAGRTSSTDLQTTPGVLQSTYGGGAEDCFIQKYSPTGTLLISTYLGGNDFDVCYGISLDATGNVYVSGKTASANFPIVGNCFIYTRPSVETWMVGKINPTLTAIIWSTYYGGTNYLTGSHDTARGRNFVDSKGNVYVEGNAGSSDFPTSPGAYQTTDKGTSDAAVVKFDTNGNRVWATMLGDANDNGNEGAFGGILADASGKVYVCGVTTASDFPTTGGAYQTTLKGSQDSFVTIFAADGKSLVTSTFLGGTGGEACQGITLDSQGNVVTISWTSSTDYPTTAGVYQRTLSWNSQRRHGGCRTFLQRGLSVVLHVSWGGGRRDAA